MKYLCEGSKWQYRGNWSLPTSTSMSPFGKSTAKLKIFRERLLAKFTFQFNIYYALTCFQALKLSSDQNELWPDMLCASQTTSENSR